ncbi:MAG: MFS transporter [Chloroflexi bacterium]|nr:MFS transporter [Chloroflexota bacterium]
MNKPSFRLQVPILTIIRTLINTMYRMVYPFLGVFRDGLGVSLPALSLALTLRSLLGACGPFLASIGDSRGRKTGMMVGWSLMVLGAGLVALWPTYPAFIAALLLTVLGKYAHDPSLMAYLGDRIPYQRRGLIVAVSEMGWSLSFIIGVPLAGFLIARSGWAAPFRWFAVLGVAAMGIMVWMLPKDTAVKRNGLPLWKNLQSVLTYPPAVIGMFIGIFISASNEVVNTVFGVWMEDAFGLKITALGLASAVIGISELSGELCVVSFTDRLGKARAISIGLVLSSLSAILLPVLARNTWGALLGLFLFYISFEFTLVSVIPMMTEIMPNSRATMTSFSAASHSLGRAMGAPIATLIYSLNWFKALSLPGITGNVLAAIIFNILALFALQYLMKTLDLQG